LCDGGGSNSNIGTIFTFYFTDSEDADYKFFFGVDFGRGSALFVNRNFVTARQEDLWWDGNWLSEDMIELDVHVEAGVDNII